MFMLRDPFRTCILMNKQRSRRDIEVWIYLLHLEIRGCKDVESAGSKQGLLAGFHEKIMRFLKARIFLTC
jgi:hypothetical protein